MQSYYLPENNSSSKLCSLAMVLEVLNHLMYVSSFNVFLFYRWSSLQKLLHVDRWIWPTVRRFYISSRVRRSCEQMQSANEKLSALGNVNIRFLLNIIWNATIHLASLTNFLLSMHYKTDPLELLLSCCAYFWHLWLSFSRKWLVIIGMGLSGQSLECWSVALALPCVE